MGDGPECGIPHPLLSELPEATLAGHSLLIPARLPEPQFFDGWIDRLFALFGREAPLRMGAAEPRAASEPLGPAPMRAALLLAAQLSLEDLLAERTRDETRRRSSRPIPGKPE